LTFI
jgi:hypothetical protein